MLILRNVDGYLYIHNYNCCLFLLLVRIFYLRIFGWSENCFSSQMSIQLPPASPNVATNPTHHLSATQTEHSSVLRIDESLLDTKLRSLPEDFFTIFI